jgi:hypothetical protein
MRAAILSLITTAALLATTSLANARPPHYRGGWGGHGYRGYGGYRGYNGVRFFPSYNTSPYYGYRSWGYPSYYGGYGGYGYPSYYNYGSYGYPSYYGSYGYSNPGLYLNLGRFGLSIGSGLPYYGGYWW